MTIDLPTLTASTFVDTNFVRVMRRTDADGVSRLCDSGTLVWVWDICLRGDSRTRDLRFWLHEVCAPQMVARLSFDEVMERILPVSRTWFWSSEVAQLLLISRTSIAVLARHLGATLKNRAFQISRSRLVAWLRERWLGGRA